MTTTAGQSETKIIVFIFTILFFFSFRLYCDFNVLRAERGYITTPVLQIFSDYKGGLNIHPQLFELPRQTFLVNIFTFAESSAEALQNLKTQRLSTLEYKNLYPAICYLYADTTETLGSAQWLRHVTLMHKTAPNCTWTAFNSCTVTCISLTTRQGYSKCLLINCPCTSFLFVRGFRIFFTQVFLD